MATLSEEEIYMAKEECVRLGECTATYYIVNLLSEVEQLKAERGAGWIPVSDRLPNIDTEVIVINANDEWGHEIVAINKTNFLGAPECADYDDFKARGYTHWMPLPEPPVV